MASEKRQKLIKLIHIAKSKLQLSDERYRAIIEGVGNGKSSCRELTIEQMESVMKSMKALGFSVKKLPVKDVDRGRASEAQLEYIKGLWELCARVKTEDALRSFVKRITYSDHLRFMTRESATKVILALRDMAFKAGFDPDGIPQASCVWTV